MEKTEIIYELVEYNRVNRCVKYFLSYKECNNKKYYINFTYPINLQVSLESKDIKQKIENNKIKNKWISAVMAKYKLKLIDSFNTKFKLFVFHKFLCLTNENFDKYFNKNFKCICADFQQFVIDEKLANTFSSQYYQKIGNEEVEYLDNNNLYKKTVDEITKNLFDYDCNGNRTYEKNYVFDMVKDSYRVLYNKKAEAKDLYKFLKNDYLKGYNNFSLDYFIELIYNRNCYYCGINIDQIEDLGKNSKLHNKRSDTRGYSLEIDRKHANLEYSEENCCMACYWCNNAKTDEFTEDEFKNIACGINISWNERLQQIGSTSKVIFPWQNQVKCCK
ncbi:hypothetical protein N5T98_00380 [Aliarcobacter cryaerophilus]|uniref:hypothetical protein n=1 Tax=Aliarcobacter cryaerophilus TaxID=28198 RepID=UPI0021B5F905|nr:hypothetical protein [Aliarcobacter cryaerophilus]MCT7485287.1 hypothetical protein [Aliarcobacter cryaerophilus]MCT7489543.1 hypothetical protein [Aliarcobacter cryaerophilus]